MGDTNRDYIAEALNLQTDKERLTWLASLNDKEHAETRRQMEQVVAAFEQWLEKSLVVLRRAAQTKTYGKLTEILPLIGSIRNTLGGSNADTKI